MRIGRSFAVGSTLALAAALAACTPVESLDDEEQTTTAVETPSESPSDEPTESPSEEPTTEEPTTEAPTTEEPDEPTVDPTDEPDADDDEPTAGGDEPTAGTEAPGADGQTIEIDHEAGRVAYVLPEGWNDLSFAYQGHPTIVMGAAPLATAANGTQLTLTAIRGGAGSFEAYRAALEDQRPPDAVMTEADPITVEGASVRGLRVEMDTPTGTFVQYTYPMFRGDQQWELQLAMDGGDEAGDHPGLIRVAESITFG